MALLSYMEETVEEAPPRDDVSASRKKRADAGVKIKFRSSFFF